MVASKDIGNATNTCFFSLINSCSFSHTCSYLNAGITITSCSGRNSLIQETHLVPWAAKTSGIVPASFSIFIGNVESRDVFEEDSDVIVCDGFTGNIVLKEAEAFYNLIKKRGYEDEYFNRFNYVVFWVIIVFNLNW